ncbi:MAG: cysteine peptidase family C39 domain-containing protein, partial [Flavobacteriaceae bacterium]|nr:cysteine peptidase family C39 domain-containing protein [Flavobacteriaceae bacterium]
MLKKFPHYKQADFKDCGATCIKIIAKHYGKPKNTQQLRNLSETTRAGSSLKGLSEASEKIGFRSLGVKVDLNKLLEAPLPCILHWNKNHYVVLYKIRFGSAQRPLLNNKKKRNETFYISDPAHGLLTYTKEEFLKHWIGGNATDTTEEGIALLLETTPKFFSNEFDKKNTDFGFKFLSKYVFKYKRFIWQLVIGLLAASLLQVVFPFLTQSVVDVGIQNQDVHFIYLILFAQLALFIGKTAIEVIRSWILLHLSTR